MGLRLNYMLSTRPHRDLLCPRRSVDTGDARPICNFCSASHRVKLPCDPVWVFEGNVVFPQGFVQLNAGISDTGI
jgi:hypothetical protein